MSFIVHNPSSKTIIKGIDGLAQTNAGMQLIGSDTTTPKNISIVPPVGNAAFTSDYKLTLPPDDGTAGQVLITDGNGVLSWGPAGGSGVFTEDAGGNIFGGTNTGQNISTGTNNFAAGISAMNSLTTGQRNIVIGLGAGGGLISSSDNITIGYEADIPNNDGNFNIILGPQARTLNASNSVVIGKDALVENCLNGSVSIGRGSITSAQNSITVGMDANSGFEYDVALGYGASVNATRAIAIGGLANIGNSGTDVITIGYGSSANTPGAIGIGTDTTLGDAYSIAIGNRAQATQARGICIGGIGSPSVTLSGAADAIAIGSGAQATVANGLAIGSGAVSNDTTRSLALTLNAATIDSSAPGAADAFIRCVINGTNYRIPLVTG